MLLLIKLPVSDDGSRLERSPFLDLPGKRELTPVFPCLLVCIKASQWDTVISGVCLTLPSREGLLSEDLSEWTSCLLSFSLCAQPEWRDYFKCCINCMLLMFMCVSCIDIRIK